MSPVVGVVQRNSSNTGRLGQHYETIKHALRTTMRDREVRGLQPTCADDSQSLWGVNRKRRT